MPPRLRDWLLFPVRTRTRAALALAALALVALGGWYGERALRFRRQREAAKGALARYDFAEARRRLAACLGLRPDDPEALLLAAQAARRDGLLDEAEGHLDRYRERAGTTPEGALQGVLLQVQRGLIQQNVQALTESVDIRHPESEQILEALAVGSVHVYNLADARFFTEQLLTRFPDNPVGRLIDAQTLETLRKRERALSAAIRLVEDYPENDKARLFLAGLLFKRGRYEEAAGHYRELHRRQPGELMPLLGLAGSLRVLGRFEEAAPFVRELQENHADNSEALLESARFALRRKRPADAEPLLLRALRLAPNDHEAHLEMATCLSQLGRADEARKHLARHREIEADLKRLDKEVFEMVKRPNDPRPRLEAGRICLRNGQVAEGLRWLAGALELDPAHKPTHQALADYYHSAGDGARAEYHRGKAR